MATLNKLLVKWQQTVFSLFLPAKMPLKSNRNIFWHFRCHTKKELSISRQWRFKPVGSFSTENDNSAKTFSSISSIFDADPFLCSCKKGRKYIYVYFSLTTPRQVQSYSAKVASMRRESIILRKHETFVVRCLLLGKHRPFDPDASEATFYLFLEHQKWNFWCYLCPICTHHSTKLKQFKRNCVFLVC